MNYNSEKCYDFIQFSYDIYHNVYNLAPSLQFAGISAQFNSFQSLLQLVTLVTISITFFTISITFFTISITISITFFTIYWGKIEAIGHAGWTTTRNGQIRIIAISVFGSVIFLWNLDVAFWELDSVTKRCLFAGCEKSPEIYPYMGIRNRGNHLIHL